MGLGGRGLGFWDWGARTTVGVWVVRFREIDEDYTKKLGLKS